MNRLYTSALLLLVLAASSCRRQQIQIEHIHTRQQLDSIIAVLPATDVKIDSIPVRVLHMKLKGLFTYYGQPVDQLLVSTKDEALTQISFDTEKGARDLIHALEADNGIGEKQYSSPILSWNTVEKKIEFVMPDFEGNLLTVSNKEKASISLYFNNPVNNRITSIYQSQHPSSNTNNYKIEVDNDECGYRIYVNGFLALDHPGARTMGVTADINSYLVKGRQQQMTVELLPGKDFDGNARKQLHLESVVHVTMTRWSENSCQSPVVLDFRTPYADTSLRTGAHSSRYTRVSKFAGQPVARTTNTFEIPPVPYELPCYATATDIRNIPDAKEKILAHYRKLKDAYEKKDPQQLENLLFPLEQNKQMAWYQFKATDGQTAWANILEKAQASTGAHLDDNVLLYITPDGRFAKLLPSENSDNPAFYLEDADKIYPLDYYVAINKNGAVQFAVN
ncbi:hypothetical protein [Chitinophaga sp.]|uniref:hypothetical protein n=1 Tax=Chitinophaga sp. TaxID=1869181 RepID=UPI002F931359